MNDLKILALDCSSSHIGVCYDGQVLPTIVLKSKDIAIRCDLAVQAISHLLADHGNNCDLLIIESPVARFASAVIPQARVSGAILAKISYMGIAWQELPPQAAKMALCQKGNANKEQMIEAAARFHIGTPMVIDEHAADAYGLWLAARKLKIEKVAA